MTLSRIAPAKVNLTIEVLGKRPDGYHDICTVLQTIDLCDTLTFAPADGLEFTCSVPDLVSPDNLVVRAAHALQLASGYEGGATVHLQKRIPIAAGLGGGSSDAAATLEGLSQLWHLEGFPIERLVEIATELGMDVPFFLRGGTAMGEGRGEALTFLPTLRTVWIVLLHPRIVVANKTAQVYRSIAPADFTSCEVTMRLAGVIKHSGLVDDSLLFNVFESVADRVFPALGSIRQRFAEVSGRPVHLAGAGPTLFCLAGNEGEAQRLRNRLLLEGFEAYACKSLASQ